MTDPYMRSYAYDMNYMIMQWWWALVHQDPAGASRWMEWFEYALEHVGDRSAAAPRGRTPEQRDAAWHDSPRPSPAAVAAATSGAVILEDDGGDRVRPVSTTTEDSQPQQPRRRRRRQRRRNNADRA
jgi:hypothetical protein